MDIVASSSVVADNILYYIGAISAIIGVVGCVVAALKIIKNKMVRINIIH